MAKFSRPTIQPLIKTSDLKKAIVEKNRKLGESVSILKQEIKSLKSEKKQAEKTYILYKLIVKIDLMNLNLLEKNFLQFRKSPYQLRRI